MSLALKFIETRTWAILDEYLELMGAIVERDLDNQAGIVEAIEKRFGTHLAGTRETTVRDGVAIIPITGPLFRYASFFTDISGATSFERLAVDIGNAMDSPEVAHVIFDVNSPGGEVDGAAETAELIASFRGHKPMTSYISHLGASAGYWLAAAADEVLVAETAMVGSIGAVLGVVDRSARDEKQGIKRMEFVSAQSPDKRVDPFSDDQGEKDRARAILQGLVDKMGAVFVEKVAGYRGMSAEAVIETKGGLLIGSDAVAAGLADGVGTLEGIIDALTGASAESRPKSLSFAAKTKLDTHMEDAIMDVKEVTEAAKAPEINRAFLEANHPELVFEFVTEGAAVERDRILAIHTLEAHGFEELKTKLMQDPSGTRGEAAAQILEAKGAQERRRAEAVSDELDADEGDVVGVSSSSLPGEEANEEDAAAAAVLSYAK
jgi:ClpP class serine protease